ncbi:serine/threonine-protein kinase [Rosistilla oblonga]|uniref:serine/threonine-protein kinase n=1 Tax=Rosistilla oblonga TaxID=2527990 RepID=UPI003A973422
MGLLDKIQSLIGKKKTEEGDFGAAAVPKSKQTKGSNSLDVEARFERMRSAVSGTMSNFITARDRQYNRVVGLKLCDAEKVATFEARFKGLKKPIEGAIAVQMQHPNVVETYEYGTTKQGQPYLVMEYVDGPGLLQVIQTRKEETLAGKRLSLIRQMAEGMKYVHEKGFIHRDICPRNFICSSDMDRIKLIDFGLTVPALPPYMQPGNRTGTPLYMAPEIVRRRQTDQRVDVFAFGVSIYTLCAFEFPWPVNDTTGKAALQHDTHPPIPILQFRPDLNPVLATAIMRCISPNVQDRMPSMEAFLRQIKGVRSELKSPA